jgi:serine/threonine protein kinase
MNNSGGSSKIGAQNYIAPEVFNQRKYCDNSDIWALGMIFLELLAGKRIHNLIESMIPPALQPDFPSESLLNHIK